MPNTTDAALLIHSLREAGHEKGAVVTKTYKELAQEADFEVACAARMFLDGHMPAWKLQEAVDKQEAAYEAWGKQLYERATQRKLEEAAKQPEKSPPYCLCTMREDCPHR